ncbi:APP_N domain-containing protein [Trichonephila clavipes]|nr:APP_N domain-containing protein [Trichonephila clavipes]
MFVIVRKPLIRLVCSIRIPNFRTKGKPSPLPFPFDFILDPSRFVAQCSSGSVSRFHTCPGSIPGLGKVNSTFHPYCSGSINEYQARLGTETLGVSLQTDHLIRTSAHALQRPMVTCTGMGTEDTSDNLDSGPNHFQPMVAVLCGHGKLLNKYLDENRRWVTDNDPKAVCTKDKLEILEYCRKATPTRKFEVHQHNLPCVGASLPSTIPQSRSVGVEASEGLDSKSTRGKVKAKDSLLGGVSNKILRFDWVAHLPGRVD